jgi:hydroxymethylglutaryl-CoA lyase
MLEGMGLRTGVDIDRLIAVRAILERALPNVPLQGAIAKAKLPKGFLRAAGCGRVGCVSASTDGIVRSQT